jgi:hypothetical protein
MSDIINPIEKETRVDEHARDMFKGMGYKELPESVINIYKAFKLKKDKLVPGKLSAEGFAFIAILAEVAEGKIDLGGENDKSEE